MEEFKKIPAEGRKIVTLPAPCEAAEPSAAMTPQPEPELSREQKLARVERKYGKDSLEMFSAINHEDLLNCFSL